MQYTIIIIICNNNNNIRTFFDLQVANFPSKLRFEANLFRDDSQSTEQVKARDDFL